MGLVADNPVSDDNENGYKGNVITINATYNNSKKYKNISSINKSNSSSSNDNIFLYIIRISRN